MRPFPSRLAAALLLAFAALLLMQPPAGAEVPEPKRPPLGLTAPSGPSAGPAAGLQGRGLAAARTPEARPQGLFGAGWAFVLEQQRRFTREIGAAVTAMKADPFGPGVFTIVFASFLYGVLHALGPGHGKGVVSSYVLASNETVRRGVLLSFLAAMIQALSAVAIFAVLNLALNARKQDFDTVDSWLAAASWGAVAVIGGWLLYRQVRAAAAARWTHPAGSVQTPDRGHGHAHDHGSDGHRQGCGHGHFHHHVHDAACGCGHNHMPAASAVQGPWSWRQALGIAASVGIRPCTGALGILALTTLNGLFWAGVAATFVMGLGTAITTSAIAALAAGSRDAATRLTGSTGPWAGRIATAAGVTGAAALLVLGTAFFVASLQQGSGPV